MFDGDNPVVWLERSLDHWLKEVSATDVVLYERWMNNEIMVGGSVLMCFEHESLVSKWFVDVCRDPFDSDVFW